MSRVWLVEKGVVDQGGGPIAAYGSKLGAMKRIDAEVHDGGEWHSSASQEFYYNTNDVYVKIIEMEVES